MDKHDADHDEAGIEELDHVPRPGGRLTGATVATVRERLLKDGLLFRLGDEGIARHFTSPFFAGNAWKVSLGDLRDVVARLDGCPDDIPLGPRAFATWVRKELLEFDHLPRERLGDLYESASSDLAEIDANIADCTKQINRVKNLRPRTDADPSDLRFYQYYLRINQEAKAEIVQVLTHGMHQEALQASYGSLNSGLIVHVAWAYRWNPRAFQHAEFSEIRHALLNLPVEELRDVERLYEDDDGSRFDTYIEAYLSTENLVGRVRSMLDEHHLLDARRRIIGPALDAYEKGEHELFASAAATQIEGIIEDACYLSGVSLKELRVASILNKLDALDRSSAMRIDYVYYAFRFPILRNRIAHGRMIVADKARTVCRLLLDLHDCCRIVCGHPGHHSDLVGLLRRTHALRASLGDVTEFMLLYAESHGQRLDEFYGLSQEFENFKLLMERQTVWLFLRQLTQLQEDEVDVGLSMVAERVGKTRPALRDSCAELRKALRGRSGLEYNRSAFIRLVRQHCDQAKPVRSASELRAIFLGLLREREVWMKSAVKAHANWVARGRLHGGDWEDWFAARRDLGVE